MSQVQTEVVGTLIAMRASGEITNHVAVALTPSHCLSRQLVTQTNSMHIFRLHAQVFCLLESHAPGIEVLGGTGRHGRVATVPQDTRERVRTAGVSHDGWRYLVLPTYIILLITLKI